MDLNNVLLAEAAKCEEQWEDSGLLEGIEDRNTRRMTALMLENQRLVNESLASGTDTSDVAQFRRISIPLVRRIYPQLIANKIVSVQPLLGPTGLVYYMRFRYATDKGATLGRTNKDYAVGTAQAESITMQQQTDGDANLDIWYTSQRIESESATGVVGSNNAVLTLSHTPLLTAGALAATVTEANLNTAVTATASTGAPGYLLWGSGVFNTTTLNFSVQSGSTPILTLNVGGANTTANGTISGSVWTFATLNYTVGAATLNTVTINTSTGVVTFAFTSFSSTATFSGLTYEYDMECNTDLPEVNLVVESETISAKTRKLKAEWSFEAQQDLRSQHNIDAEAELTQILAKEINLEIDREILMDLRVNAGTVSTWDFATALGDTIKEKYESLYVKVVEVSNIIHRKTLRGGANWIVTSPEVASIFETATAGFAPAPSNNFESSMGIQYVGTVNNRWRLFKDPLFQRGSILMGYRGDSYMDSGYFYCPYVPLTQTPVVLDPNSFCPRRGVLTRYGKKLLREGSKFYARVSIQNFII